MTPNIERLERLVTILDRVPDERFDLTSWRDLTCCGTVACAVGWATMNEQFRAEGLRYVQQEPRYADVSGWKAVMAFFSLDDQQVEYLFDADDYPNVEDTSVSEVIHRLCAFIAEHRPKPALEPEVATALETKETEHA